jgi:hypothetical protein
VPDTTPKNDRLRAQLMLLGVPAEMLHRRSLRRIVADSTGMSPSEELTADALARTVISLAERGQLKMPKFRGE